MRVGLGSFDVEDETARAHWLTTVPATCSLWRQIALSTPALWAHVAFYFAGEHEFTSSLDHADLEVFPDPAVGEGEEDGLEARRMRRDLAMAQVFFRRSGALKLALNIRWSSVYGAPSRENVRTFASLLERHATRIQSIVFRGQCSAQFLPTPIFASLSSLSASSSSTPSPSLLPHLLPNLTCLDIYSEVIPIDDAPNGIPLALFPSDADASNTDAASPWTLASLRAPRLKQITYRAQTPTRSFSELVQHSPKLDTLIVHFDTLSERPDQTALSSASLRELTVIGGDTWTLEQLVGEMPCLESLSTLPHSFASPHHAWSIPTPIPSPHISRFGGVSYFSSAVETQSFPSLRMLNMRPMQSFGEEDVEFVNTQRKLEELDLEDRYFPTEILASLIVAPRVMRGMSGGAPGKRRRRASRTASSSRTGSDVSDNEGGFPIASGEESDDEDDSYAPSMISESSSSKARIRDAFDQLEGMRSPALSAFSLKSASHSHSQSRRSSHSLSHASSLSSSFLAYFLTPNPSLKVLRLHRTRLSSSTEHEWANILALVGTLMAQREGLEVHFVGGAEGVNAKGQVRCAAGLFALVRRFGGRVWVTAGEGAC